MSIDTLALARELRAAEMPQAQAEAFAAALGRSFSETAATKADLDQLAATTKADLNQLAAATKADLNQLAAAAKADLNQLESRLDTKIEKATSRLLFWFIGTNTALAAMLVAAIKF